jgi:Predicted nucleotide-binding protein containing TIR-like domain
MVVSRGVEKVSARDNVLFELGLFIGSLGRDRTFMLYDRTDPPGLPSDLAGVTPATFAPHASGNLVAALGAACTKIQDAVEKLGIRENKGLLDLEKATSNVNSVGRTIQSLLQLLVRSRKVELDIVINQFGPMIESEKLQQMKRDLTDLEKVLDEQ